MTRATGPGPWFCSPAYGWAAIRDRLHARCDQQLHDHRKDRTMDFTTARAVEMPWGRYAGQTLDQIATTDAGLLYLDWLAGELDRDSYPDLGQALQAYLADACIARDLQRLLGDR